jgi:hypothetical protein
VLNGSGVPDSGLGVDGDFYIDTDESDMYGPKTGGAWGSATSLVGDVGPAGDLDSTIVDAKGDLIVATGADAVSRLAVGDDDFVLTADSSTGTGLKWAAGGGGGSVITYGSPSVDAAGDGASHVLVPFIGQIPMDTGGAAATLVNGTLYGIPCVIPFDIQITATLLFATGAWGSTTAARTGFVPATSAWKPEATGLISGPTLTSTAVSTTTVNIPAGRYLRLFRVEGADLTTAYGARYANMWVPTMAYQSGAWSYPSGVLHEPSTGTGALADTIPDLDNGYTASASYSGGALAGLGFRDPFLYAWVPT